MMSAAVLVLPAAGTMGGMMSYSVGRIPGGIRIDPDAGGQERQRKRERPAQQGGGRDSVSISEEARTRSISAADDQEAEALPAPG